MKQRDVLVGALACGGVGLAAMTALDVFILLHNKYSPFLLALRLRWHHAKLEGQSTPSSFRHSDLGDCNGNRGGRKQGTEEEELA